MNKEKIEQLLEMILDGTVYLGYVTTLLATIVLTTVGVYEIIEYPFWYHMIYFLGAGVSLLFHFIIKLLQGSNQ